MFKFVSLLLLAGFVAADTVIDLNNQTDFALNLANKILTRKGLGIHPLPPLSFPGVELAEGVTIGANSQMRTRDCTLTVSTDNKTLAVDLHTGLRLFVMAFGKIQPDGVDAMSGVINIKSNSVHLSFNVTTSPRCDVRVEDYEIEELSGVTLSTSASDENRDLTDYFAQNVVPAVNKFYSNSRPLLQHVLKRVICHHRNNIPEVLPHIFNTISLIHTSQ